MARKNAVVSVEYNETSNELNFTVAGEGTLTLDVRALSADVINRASIHGLTQKVSDAAALGADATPADKFEAMSAVIERLMDGDWNKRTGDGTGSAPSGIIFRAYAEYMNDRLVVAGRDTMPDEKLRIVYDKKDRKEQLALRTVPEIAAIMERIKSEKVSKSAKVDADSLLDELDDIDG